MRIGSLVECIDTFPYCEDLVIPIKGNIYTVRGIEVNTGCCKDCIHKGTFLLLEEISNDLIPGEGEPAFDIDGFREIQPPMKIIVEELIEELV